MTDPSSLRRLAEATALAVGAETADAVRSASDHGSRSTGTTETKSSLTDLVTEYDRRAEARIVASILAARPDDGFFGEEGTRTTGTSGVTWVIDPIDGTTNFVLGHPGWAVSIAAEVDGVAVAGAVADPVHGQLFSAARGAGATLNDEPIAPRTTTELGVAVLATGFGYAAELRARQARVLTHVLPRVGNLRRMGSAAVDLCSVAMGRVDGYYEVGLNRWDLAAGALIAEEAGAVVALPSTADAPIIAAAPGIAAALVALLADAHAH